MGLVLAGKTAFALSTTESADQIIPTYQYIRPGRVTLYAKASAATVFCNLFIQGVQVLRSLNVPFTGTAGTLDRSANKVTSVNTMGGRVEMTFIASTGTPTVDFVLEHEGMPLVGGFLGGIANLVRGR